MIKKKNYGKKFFFGGAKYNKYDDVNLENI